jgi:citrate synthase
MSKPKPFWREAPLVQEEVDLFFAVLAAHNASALRQNISAEVVRLAAAGSGNFGQSIAAGLLSLGGAHGPIEKAADVLMVDGLAKNLLDRGERVPGWGSSFVKHGPDPIWAGVADRLEAWPVATTMLRITNLLHEHGKHIWPNAACMTAASGIVLGMPPVVMPYLFLAGRLEAWSQIVMLTTAK